jgi:hypothetical protein
MGIFDWLSRPKSNLDVLDDRIWLTKQAKFAGISAATEQCFAEPERPFAVLLVAMFQDCLAELEAIAEQRGSAQRRVIPVLADDLSGRGLSAVSPDDSEYIMLIVGERHPIDAHNAGVAEFARGLPCRCRLVHHLSLEDPLLQMFASEWVQNILQSLGMKEDEAIESRMVARRIQQAAQQIENQAVSDLRANSAEEWMQLNCPELRQRMNHD